MEDKAPEIAQAIWDQLQEMGFWPINDQNRTTTEIIACLRGQQEWAIIAQKTEEISDGVLADTIIPIDLVLEVKEPGLKIVLHPFINYAEAKLGGQDFPAIKKALLKNQGQRQKENPILIISRPNRKTRHWHITAGSNAIPCPQALIDLGRQKLILRKIQTRQVLAQLKAVQNQTS